MMERSDLPGLTVCGSCAGETAGQGEGGRARRLDRYAAMEREHRARVTTVECLDQCGRGDVLVVRPAASQRDATDPVWLAGMANVADVAELARWLGAGGPGAAPVPVALAPFVLPRGEPGREARAAQVATVPSA